jgi:hypothetical protein
MNTSRKCVKALVSPRDDSPQSAPRKVDPASMNLGATSTVFWPSFVRFEHGSARPAEDWVSSSLECGRSGLPGAGSECAGDVEPLIAERERRR